MNQVNYRNKCKCCHSTVDSDAIVDIDKSGTYIYFCSEDCYNNKSKGNKNERASRESRRREKYNYD